jgi:hypothetical protein
MQIAQASTTSHGGASIGGSSVEDVKRQLGRLRKACKGSEDAITEVALLTVLGRVQLIDAVVDAVVEGVKEWTWEDNSPLIPERLQNAAKLYLGTLPV